MEIKQIYTFNDLLTIFPFGKTKLRQLLKAGVLPVVKIGRQYITTESLLNRWFEENMGKEILF